MISDTFKTIEKPTLEVLYKEKNSKFFGIAYPVQSEIEVKEYLENLKKIHPSAGHFCYAYKLGLENIYYRVNDDGEPNNSAGMPIYGQILSNDLTNILVVVIRYFGGVKLGVGGLIQAYRETAKLTLEQAIITEKIIECTLLLNFNYEDLSKVMRIIKEKNLKINSQSMNEKCSLEIITRKKEEKMVKDLFLTIRNLKIVQL